MKQNLLHAVVGLVLAMTTQSLFAQDVTEAVSVKNDVTLRSDKADEAFPTNKTLELYTLLKDDKSIERDFIGLMSFQVPVKSGYSVKTATLKLVTERAKGDLAIYALGADVSDADTYNSQKENVTIARASEPLVVTKLKGTSGKATFDGGASSNLEDWVNTIDLTDYVQQQANGKVNLLLVNHAESTPTSIQVYTSDAEDMTNTKVELNFTFKADDLKPLLTVVYEKKENVMSSVLDPTADTWVMKGNASSRGTAEKIELWYQEQTDQAPKEIDGLMSFHLPALALSADYTIKSALLRF